MRDEATLYILSGLPGSGKTSISRLLARRLGATYLRIDTIEQGLRELCSFDVEGEGYRLAYRIAADNLRLGTSVVADSVNPIELTRREWEDVARETGVRHVNIEVRCSDSSEHRQRVGTRVQDIGGLRQPTWDEVENRTYDAWTVDRIVVDTAAKSVEDCVEEVLARLSRPQALGQQPE